MALKFNGKSIPGTHGPIVPEAPAFKHKRTAHWDVIGESEIGGRTGGRLLAATILIHNDYTGAKPTSLLKFLAELDQRTGEHGDLVESGDVAQTFQHCTFEGLERLPFGGQEEAGPLLDVAGTLDGGWWIHGRLHFYQLTVGQAQANQGGK